MSASWDHPRIRGEHPNAHSRMPGSLGSSPHTRGAHSTASSKKCRPRDHPRIRGEHPLLTPGFRDGMGSSPHTRGALDRVGRDLDDVGIIPAYAGSTRPACARGRSPQDHPRIRGEHPWPADRPHRICRIIPAYAGSTTPSWKVTGNPEDHPRIRGEHAIHTRRADCSDGSSPHTRGAPDAEGGHGLLERIIPAYAGSTSRACPNRRPF